MKQYLIRTSLVISILFCFVSCLSIPSNEYGKEKDSTGKEKKIFIRINDVLDSEDPIAALDEYFEKYHNEQNFYYAGNDLYLHRIYMHPHGQEDIARYLIRRGFHKNDTVMPGEHKFWHVMLLLSRAPYPKDLLQMILDDDGCNAIAFSDENLYIPTQYQDPQWAVLKRTEDQDYLMMFMHHGYTPIPHVVEEILKADWVSGDSKLEALSLVMKNSDGFYTDEDLNRIAVRIISDRKTELFGPVIDYLPVLDIKSRINPLHLMISFGYEEEFLEIAPRIENISMRNKNGESFLHIAAQKSMQKLTAYLLSCGVNVNIPDYHGASPLHKALTQENTLITRMLLDAGADIGAVDNEHNSCFDIAVSAHMDPQIRLLAEILPADYFFTTEYNIKTTFDSRLELENPAGLYFHVAAASSPKAVEIWFSEDGTFRMKNSGKISEGKWILNGRWLYLTETSGKLKELDWWRIKWYYNFSRI